MLGTTGMILLTICDILPRNVWKLLFVSVREGRFGSFSPDVVVDPATKVENESQRRSQMISKGFALVEIDCYMCSWITSWWFIDFVHWDSFLGTLHSGKRLIFYALQYLLHSHIHQGRSRLRQKWPVRDLNSRPSGLESEALPTELTSRYCN